MNPQTIRLIAAGAIVWYALGMPGTSTPIAPSAPYTGSMSAVHSASRSMDAHDRQGLSEALASAGKMLADDKAGLIKNTEDAQRFARGAIAYGYSSFSIQKYPQVASAMQSELERATGSVVTEETSEIRQKMSEALEEIGRAVR